MKQVIVIRKDLNMRKGKMVAQGGHAVVEAVLNGNLRMIHAWVEQGQAKICVGVDSEAELFQIRDAAIAADLNIGMIQDEGRTEFKEPTWTALCIGPDENTKIDKITGHLKLL